MGRADVERQQHFAHVGYQMGIENQELSRPLGDRDAHPFKSGFCFIRLAKVKHLSIKADFSRAKPLIVANVLLSALGGLMWYLQFFFYAWGHAINSRAV